MIYVTYTLLHKHAQTISRHSGNRWGAAVTGGGVNCQSRQLFWLAGQVGFDEGKLKTKGPLSSENSLRAPQEGRRAAQEKELGRRRGTRTDVHNLFPIRVRILFAAHRVLNNGGAKRRQMGQTPMITQMPLGTSRKKIRQSRLYLQAVGRWAFRRSGAHAFSCRALLSRHIKTQDEVEKDRLLTFKKLPPCLTRICPPVFQWGCSVSFFFSLFDIQPQYLLSFFIAKQRPGEPCLRKGDKEQYETQIHIQIIQSLWRVKLVITFPSKCRFDVATPLD